MIHTSAGAPVYVEYADNYQDLRERFRPTVERFRRQLQLAEEMILTMVVDRGIYGLEMFKAALEEPRLHLMTWEKNYPGGGVGREGRRRRVYPGAASEPGE